jgi:hypothetical protein
MPARQVTLFSLVLVLWQGNALLSNRLDDAQKWLEEAITLQPDDADAKVMLQLWRTGMFISSTISLGARVSLLLVPLVTGLDPAIHLLCEMSCEEEWTPGSSVQVHFMLANRERPIERWR